MPRTTTSRRSSSGGFLSHKSLLAVEALLFIGVAKDWIFGLFLELPLPNWGKVVLVMLTTVGLFGGLFILVKKVLSQGLKQTNKLAFGLSIVLPTLVIHAILLFLLFLLYARKLHLTVF